MTKPQMQTCKGHPNLRIIRRSYLVVVLKVVVGDGDVSGSLNDINKAISAAREITVVHPDVVRPEDVNGISVRFASASVMGGRAPYISRSGGLTVVNVDVVNNNVVNILNSKARSSSDVHIVTTTVESLVTVHDELLLEFNVHVAAEHDPERLGLNDAIAKCTFFGVNNIVIAFIGNNVDFSIFTPDGILAKAKGAIRELLPIFGPV